MSSATGQPGEYKTGDASRLAGLHPRTVDYWAKTRLLVPSVADACGSGSDRFYTYDDLVILRALADMRDLTMQSRRKVVEAMRRNAAAEIVRVELSAVVDLIIKVGQIKSELGLPTVRRWRSGGAKERF